MPGVFWDQVRVHGCYWVLSITFRGAKLGNRGQIEYGQAGFAQPLNLALEGGQHAVCQPVELRRPVRADPKLAWTGSIHACSRILWRNDALSRRTPMVCSRCDAIRSW